MEKRRSKQEIFRQLETSHLRAVTGGGRLRVPGGRTDGADPTDEEGSGTDAEYARIFVPGG